MKKDYIGWSIGIVSIIIAVVFGLQNKELKHNRQQIYNHAQNIQQFIINNNYNIPPMIEKEVQSIEMASGPTVTTKFK